MLIFRYIVCDVAHLYSRLSHEATINLAAGCVHPDLVDAALEGFKRLPRFLQISLALILEFSVAGLLTSGIRDPMTPHSL